MTLCLKKIRGLRKVEKVVDSQWLWTEPHSRRVKLKLTVQRDVLDGQASVQQSLVVEGIIQPTQCDDCKKAFTPHAGWTAMVQVRQHAEHKRTFLFLEQLVLKHELAARLLNVVERPDGLDFHFPSRQPAQQFAEFCQSRFPCATKQAKQLVSHDASSNTHFYKYTISVTLAPVCKGDLVFLRRGLGGLFSGFPALSICSRVGGGGLQLVCPFSARSLSVSPEKYWRTPFQPLCTRRHLSTFFVVDVRPLARAEASGSAPARGPRGGGSRKARKRSGGPAASGPPAAPSGTATPLPTTGTTAPLGSCLEAYEVELLRAADLGHAERAEVTRSHLGRVLQAGDWVRAFDLRSINLSGAAEEALSSQDRPRRASPPKGKKRRRRRREEKAADGGGLEASMEAEALAVDSQEEDEEREESGLAACAPWSVVIVKKIPSRVAAAEVEGRQCCLQPWVLQTLRKERKGEEGPQQRKRGDRRPEHGMEADMAAFQQELAEDAEMRAEVNLWRDPRRPQQRPSRQSRAAKKEGKSQQMDAPSDAHKEPQSEAESEAKDSEGEELAELMDGLTLENGELRGLVVAPGAALQNEEEEGAAVLKARGLKGSPRSSP